LAGGAPGDAGVDVTGIDEGGRRQGGDVTQVAEGSLDLDRSPGPARGRRGPLLVEVTLLLAAPLLLIFPLRAEVFGRTNMIDPYLHTAVIQHGRELLERFGNNRQFARAGFTVPGRAFVLAFGDIGGYYAFRYALVLLAMVPAYVLFRRLHGRPAGAVAAASVLASAVIVRAWSSDYPDSAGVTYLIAACCCLCMPTDSRTARWSWFTASAGLFSLALHSNFVAVPFVLAAVIAYAAFHVKEWRHLLAAGGVFLVVVAAVSAALSVGTWAAFGTADIFRPTWRAFEGLRRPEAIAVNHSTNWRWVLDAPYLLVLPLILVVWIALARLRRKAFSQSEWMLWLTLSLQVGASVVMQFALEHQILEFHFYSSLLWAAATLVAASTVIELSRPLLVRPRLSWVPAAVLVAVPVAFAVLDVELSLRFATALLLATAAAVVVTALYLTRSTIAGLGALAIFTVVAHTLVIGQSSYLPLRSGQALFPRPQYGLAFGGLNAFERDRYMVISELDDVVPAPPTAGVPLVIWAADDVSETVSIAASQYGWRPRMVLGLPRLDSASVAQIRTTRPDIVLLLSDAADSVAAGEAGIRRLLPEATVLADATLEHGDVRLHVSVVGLR
jgi:Dolichyl-phosphate-mannose-protein mannosyltransferase